MTPFQPVRQILHGMLRPNHTHSVIVLRAYFDDSGTHAGSPAIVWAGFMATIEEWDIIEGEWSALLAREGLKTFHMADIENGVGQCDLWSRARRDSVIHDFRQILAARDIIGIGAVLRTADWSEVIVGDWLNQRFPSPVLFVFEHAIQQAIHWAQQAEIQSGLSGQVDFFFDLRRNEEATAFDLARRYGLLERWSPWFHGAFFGKMSEVIPLQTADMLAYESYRLERERYVQGAEPSLRAHMHALLRDVPCHGQYYDREALKTLVSQVLENENPDLLDPFSEGGLAR